MKVDPRALSPDAVYYWQIATIVPRPIAWVSTLNEDGSTNLAPFSFFAGICPEPPLCLICVSHKKAVPGEVRQRKDTWRNIERTREYVIHVVNDALGPQMNATSREHPYGTDELAATGLTKLPSERIAVPRVAEAPVAIECRLDRIIEVGRPGTAIIVGEMLLWHVHDDLIVQGRIDAGRLDAIGRMSGPSYAHTRDRFDMIRPK